MNLEQARIVLRGRPLSETFDLALKWLVSVRGPYVRLSLLTLLPSFALCIAARWWLQWDWIWVWALACGLGLLAQGPFTVAASRLMFAPDVSARSAVWEFARRSPAYIVAMVLTRTLCALTAFGILLPAIVWTPFAFVPEAILLEGQGVGDGISRATKFNRGQTGVVLALFIGLSAALTGFVIGFDQLGFAVLDFTLQLGRPFESLWEEGGSASALLGFFAAIPYMTTARFLQYIDGRTRRDGWDIQLAFLSIAMREDARQEAAA